MSEYVSVQEYAEFKGVTDRTVYRWIKSGDVDVKEIDGKLHVKVDEQDNITIDRNVIIEKLTSENEHLRADVEYLQTQLSQTLASIEEHRQRSDTIVLQLTQQVEQLTNQNQLLLEDFRPNRRWYHKLFAWNGT